MYNDSDVSMQEHVSPGTINLGTRGPRKFVQGHIVSGRPITPPKNACQIKFWNSCLEKPRYNQTNMKSVRNKEGLVIKELVVYIVRCEVRSGRPNAPRYARAIWAATGRDFHTHPF